MAQRSDMVITPESLANADWRTKFVEVQTAPNDFASAEFSILLSTVPFLPPGENFTDLPLYPVGLAQNFAYNEGLNGMMVPELGSGRKLNIAAGSLGSATMSRLQFHGNSLAAALYRPTLLWLKETQSVSAFMDEWLSPSDDRYWIKGILSPSFNLYDSGLDQYVNQVVATGGLSSVLFKIPFGLIEIRRDARKMVLAINYFEQCGLRGDQSGVTAGQFQVAENLSFEFERKRPLRTANNFVLSDDITIGV